jgi:hypothetical protein
MRVQRCSASCNTVYSNSVARQQFPLQSVTPTTLTLLVHFFTIVLATVALFQITPIRLILHLQRPPSRVVRSG